MAANITTQQPEIPKRITVTQEGDTVIIKLAAAAIYGKIIMTATLILSFGIPLSILYTQDDLQLLLADLFDNPILFVIPAIISVGVLIVVLMRGFNVTTFTLTPTELRRRTAPIGFTILKIPADEIHGVAARIQRTSRIGREDGIYIYPFEVGVFDADNKRTVVKCDVRGRRHSLFIVWKIADTYGVASADKTHARLIDAQNQNTIVKLLAD